MSTASTLGQLSQEVGTLLRHDNLDVRIHQWLTITWTDLLSRASVWRLCQLRGAGSISMGNYSTSVNGPIQDILGVYIHLQASPLTVYTPKYVQYSDFCRIAFSQDGGEMPTGAPLIYTLGPSTSSGNNQTLMVYPAATGILVPHILTVGTGWTIPSVTTAGFALPYHWENVLIWGAASIGAKSLMSHLYPLFQGEYEEAIQKMISMLTYRPDSTPVMRSVVSPYGGTVTGRRFRLPEEIPGP